MQQAAGIIAEYNPFHNGHLYHLQQTKEKKKSASNSYYERQYYAARRASFIG